MVGVCEQVLCCRTRRLLFAHFGNINENSSSYIQKNSLTKRGNTSLSKKGLFDEVS
jgi:hypothetical protein